MELARFALPGRTPATTDVFCLAAGGALGAWLFRRRDRRGHRRTAPSPGRAVDPALGGPT